MRGFGWLAHGARREGPPPSLRASSALLPGVGRPHLSRAASSVSPRPDPSIRASLALSLIFLFVQPLPCFQRLELARERGRGQRLGSACDLNLNPPLPTADTPAERAIADRIAAALPSALEVAVRDSSGGCGTMYQLRVIDPSFHGMGKLKQQRAVLGPLHDLVPTWHGFTLDTRAE